ncbi:MAG: hypothetical protein H6667_23190 [Ardenticatenaceae bacterium]|nr:hypothetical protein [Ardenticatenaceae bacterium]
MTNQEKPYLSYLLRLWLVQNQTHCGAWRCSLENVQTGERHGFASLEALCEFLGEKIAPLPEGNGVDDVVE